MTKWDDLEKLAALKKKGVITDAEFEEQKKALLSRDEDVSAGDDISPLGRYIGCFKKYATFQGRANRAEYWWFFLFNLLVFFGLPFLVSFVDYFDGLVASVFAIVCVVYRIIAILPSMAVGVRRMHDTNHSGWWYFLPRITLWTAAILAAAGMIIDYAFSSVYVIPPALMLILLTGLGIATIVFGIIYLIFTLLPGTKGENRYGKVPV